MERRIKLIWDLRNLEVEKTASDHCENIKFFAAKAGKKYHDIGSEVIAEHYAIAYIIIDEIDMILFRDSLRPHRAEVAQ